MAGRLWAAPERQAPAGRSPTPTVPAGQPGPRSGGRRGPLRAERRALAHAGRALGGPGSEKCRCPSKDISVASKCWQL